MRDIDLYNQLFPDLTSRSQQTRIAMIEAAVAHVGSGGFESLTFEAIATRTGTNRAHVRYHYPSLADALADCVRYVIHKGQALTLELLSKESHWQGQLGAIIRAALIYFHGHPSAVAVLIAMTQRGLYDPAFRSLYDDIRTSGCKRMAAVLEPVFGSTAPAKAQAMKAARSIQNLTYGHIFDHASLGSPGSGLKAYYDTVVEQVFEVVYAALRQR